MPVSIKNIIFDVGGVLLKYRPREYTYRIISDPKAAEAVYRNLFDGDEWKQIDGGTMTEEEGIARVVKRIPQFADSVQLAMADWPSCLKVNEGMPEILGRLKSENYKLYLLSNTSLRFYEYSPKFEMFRLFDGMVISAKEKLLKPDPAIYHCLANRFHLKLKECLFIDDMQVNIEGAEKVGMHGHHFENAEELDSYFRLAGFYKCAAFQECPQTEFRMQG